MNRNIFLINCVTNIVLLFQRANFFFIHPFTAKIMHRASVKSRPSTTRKNRTDASHHLFFLSVRFAVLTSSRFAIVWPTQMKEKKLNSFLGATKRKVKSSKQSIMETTSTQLAIYLMIAKQWANKTQTEMPNLDKLIKYLLELPNEEPILIATMPF